MVLVARKQVDLAYGAGPLATTDPGGGAVWAGDIPFDLNSSYTMTLDRNVTLDWRPDPAPVLGVVSRIMLDDDGGNAPGYWTLTLFAEASTVYGSYEPSAGVNILSMICVDATPGSEDFRASYTTGLLVPQVEVKTIVTRSVIPAITGQVTEPDSLRMYVNGNTLIPGITPGLTFTGPSTLNWNEPFAGYALTPNDLVLVQFI